MHVIISPSRQKKINSKNSIIRHGADLKNKVVSIKECRVQYWSVRHDAIVHVKTTFLKYVFGIFQGQKYIIRHLLGIIRHLLKKGKEIDAFFAHESHLV